MSTRHDEDKLIEALMKLPAGESEQERDELLLLIGNIKSLRQRIEKLAAIVEGAPGRRVTELRGLGKEVWRGGDAQEYVNSERDSWQG